MKLNSNGVRAVQASRVGAGDKLLAGEAGSSRSVHHDSLWDKLEPGEVRAAEEV